MRVRRPLTFALAVVTAASLTLPATAQEGPSSSQVEGRLASAEARLDELEARASLAVEEFNQAQVGLEQAEAALEDTTAEAAEVVEQVDRLRVTTDAVARALYKAGGTNLQFGTLVTSDGPSEAGARYATVKRVLRGHRGDVQALQAAQVQLASLEERITEQRDEAAERADELDARRAEVEATLASQADEIERLEAELAQAREREEAARRAEEARRRAEAEARAAAERRAAEREAAAERQAAPTPKPASNPKPSSSPGPRRSAQVAVDKAMEQVGKPYRYGAAGPDSFDCSGLMLYSWRAAGVELPRTSRAQYSATRRISRGDLQPGDLVFFGSPIHHVAMYIGNGRVVEASRSGVPVRTSDRAMSRSDIAGYGRP